jgi:hypothetical protein
LLERPFVIRLGHGEEALDAAGANGGEGGSSDCRRRAKRQVLYLTGRGGISMQTFARRGGVQNKCTTVAAAMEVRVATIWILVLAKVNFMNL